jgi:hypothetical protein
MPNRTVTFSLLLQEYQLGLVGEQAHVMRYCVAAERTMRQYADSRPAAAPDRPGPIVWPTQVSINSSHPWRCNRDDCAVEACAVVTSDFVGDLPRLP